MNIIINEDQLNRLLLNEEDNEAYTRHQDMPDNLKKIWAVIAEKQKKLEEALYGSLSEKIYDITQEKINAMGGKYKRLPSIMFKAGNDKLPKSVLFVNMSSSLMCPSYFLGLCNITKGQCYAQSAENRHTNTVLPIRWKTDIMYTQMLQQYQHGNKDPMKQYFNLVETYIQLGNAYSKNIIRQQAQKMVKKFGRPLKEWEKEFLNIQWNEYRITDVRLNETGDFHCQLAVDLWDKFAGKIKRKYGINTHAYTSRLLDFSNVKNMAVNTSRTDANTGDNPKRIFKAVSDEVYESLNGGDEVVNRQPVLGYNGSKWFYKCPCTEGNSACEDCGVCFDRNKTGKPYTIYVRYHGVKNANGLKNLFTTTEVENVIKGMERNGWISDEENKVFNKRGVKKSLKDYDKGVLNKRNNAKK